MVQWGHNAALLGEFLLGVFIWIGTWNLIDLPINLYVQKFWQKMLIYTFLFLIPAILLLTLGDQFVSWGN